MGAHTMENRTFVDFLPESELFKLDENYAEKLAKRAAWERQERQEWLDYESSQSFDD